MGGLNESVLPADKKAGAASPSMGGPPGTILAPDYIPPSVETVSLSAALNVQNSGIAIQTQAIRQHMNAGQIHLHLDGPNPLKVAIPVAEWYVIMRHLRSLNPYTFVDTENKSVAYLRPFVSAGMFEVAIEVQPIHIGPRFAEMNVVTGKR